MHTWPCVLHGLKLEALLRCASTDPVVTHITPATLESPACLAVTHPTVDHILTKPSLGRRVQLWNWPRADRDACTMQDLVEKVASMALVLLSHRCV